MTGLRFKIFLAMGALVVAAVGLLGFLSLGVTRTGVHQIVEMEEARGREVDLTLAETLRRDLEKAWARDGDFRASGELLAGFEKATGDALGMALFDDRPELVAGFGMPSTRVEPRSLALLLGGLLARRIVRPVEALADPARARRAGGGGGGLGLAIVKALVELHGGSVGADNAPGGGAAVIVTLPTSGSVPLR